MSRRDFIIPFVELIPDMGRIPNWGKVLLFLSSYSPLYVIIALRAHNASYTIQGYTLKPMDIVGIKLSILSIGMLVLAAITLGFLWWMIRLRRTRQGFQSDVNAIQNQSDMFTEYLLVYIFPFILFEFSDIYDVAAFLILFLTVAVIVIQSNRLYTNPVLSVPPLSYKIYQIETENGRELLLTKDQLNGQDISLNMVKISNEVYIATQ